MGLFSKKYNKKQSILFQKKDEPLPEQQNEIQDEETEALIKPMTTRSHSVYKDGGAIKRNDKPIIIPNFKSKKDVHREKPVKIDVHKNNIRLVF